MLPKSKLQPVHLEMEEGAAHHPALNNCLLHHIPPSRQLTSPRPAFTPHPATRLRSPSCSCTCSRSFLSPPSVFVALATHPHHPCRRPPARANQGSGQITVLMAAERMVLTQHSACVDVCVYARGAGMFYSQLQQKGFGFHRPGAKKGLCARGQSTGVS